MRLFGHFRCTMWSQQTLSPILSIVDTLMIFLKKWPPSSKLHRINFLKIYGVIFFLNASMEVLTAAHNLHVRDTTEMISLTYTWHMIDCSKALQRSTDANNPIIKVSKSCSKEKCFDFLSELIMLSVHPFAESSSTLSINSFPHLAISVDACVVCLVESTR